MSKLYDYCLNSEEIGNKYMLIIDLGHLIFSIFMFTII